MALRDYTYFEIRDILQVSVGFISKWKQTEARGVAGLLLQYQGSSGYLERKQQQDVIGWLKQKNYWNLRELQQYVEDTYNVVFASKQSYYDIFKVAGISWKKSQKRNPKADPNLVEKKTGDCDLVGEPSSVNRHRSTGGVLSRRIISFSSSVVGLYQPTYAIYAATKAGVEAMTHVLSKELRGRNITVNAIAPGPTATELFLKGKPQEDINQLAKLAPLERLGEPEDIANAVAFLSSSDAAWINGQVLRANGGII